MQDGTHAINMALALAEAVAHQLDRAKLAADLDQIRRRHAKHERDDDARAIKVLLMAVVLSER